MFIVFFFFFVDTEWNLSKKSRFCSRVLPAVGILTSMDSFYSEVGCTVELHAPYILHFFYIIIQPDDLCKLKRC